MIETYLVKRVTSGNLAMEYQVVRMKPDMRKKFCKKHQEDIVDCWELVKAILQHGMKVKDNRVIAPNGKTAYEFSRTIKYSKKQKA